MPIPVLFLWITTNHKLKLRLPHLTKASVFAVTVVMLKSNEISIIRNF